MRNRRIVITRDKSQAESLARRIKELGGKAIFFPTIEIREPDDWQACDAALSGLRSYDWVVFTSVNGVNYFFDRLNELNLSGESFKVAAVGKRTAEALEKRGRKADLVPDEHTASGLLNAFSALELRGARFLLPTSNIAYRRLPEGLIELGARVDKLVVYHTVANRSVDAESMRMQIKNDEIDCLTFFSPSAFNYFIEIVGEPIVEDIKKSAVTIAAIGPTTSKAIAKLNLNVDVVPDRSLVEDFVEALAAFYSNRN
ncbi:MAG: hypothetical protein GTO42_01380 [Candidatus Latescibacteria bacterium]|nr:hypothetical protein [Candidatus Latescibacterota bacterium]NIO27181.1 hypothetical protein [Candidatus Latescibacterota bacterium]NIO54705.1 hypothetical protein [Candidatus Latescibacterota bacterium]NIT00788.1 hypothetical protein [Candidatus Latescibacterota bacterium]NIT37711.1 hypothetical protein [Candidatus Latescibacterota bacterium]